jgi:hypothetical protein
MTRMMTMTTVIMARMNSGTIMMVITSRSGTAGTGAAAGAIAATCGGWTSDRARGR